MAHIEARHEGLFTHTAVAPALPVASNGRRRWATLIGIAAVAVAAVGLGLLTYERVNDSATTGFPAIVTGVSVERSPLEVYQPGGSVYDAQVPAQARTAGSLEFAPGGSVYDAQVPAQARTAGSLEFAPGGSVYEQQVP